MENFAYNPQSESKSAYEKYVEQRKKWKVFALSDEDKIKLQNQKKELSSLEQEINILENQPIMINQEEVLRKIQGIDRLKTLKFLSHMHLNIKNGLTKHLLDDDEKEAFQEYINGDEQLKNKFQKHKKILQSQKDDLLGKLDFNQQVMLKFIDQQQRIDMKCKHQETQYETPIHYQMIENQEQLLAQQVDIEMQQKITELQRKIDNQTLAKKQSNEEMQQIHKQIKNLKKENENLKKETEDNIMLLDMEQHQKDSQQKAQYALILQNKLNQVYSECANDAHTHNIDLITILTSRASEQQLQIQKLEELLKDLSERYNVTLNIQKMDLDDLDKEIDQIYKQAKQDQNQQEKQKTQKIQKKKVQQKQDIQQKQENQEESDADNQQQNIQNQEQSQEEYEEEDQDKNKKKPKKLTQKQQNMKQSQLKIQKLENDQDFTKLSVQDKLNYILNDKEISIELKQQMVKDFQIHNRSLLNKNDQKMLNNIVSMNLEDFQTMTSTPIILPSKVEQIKKLQLVNEKYKKVEQKPIKNNYPVQKARYLDQTKATLLKQQKIIFKEEMNNYFLDWRLKEYLTLKGIRPKIRQQYIQMAKTFFTEMEIQLNEFEKNEMSKQLNNVSSLQDNTTLDTFNQNQTQESIMNNTMQTKQIHKDIQTINNDTTNTFKNQLSNKIKMKTQRNEKYYDDEFSWVTPSTKLTLYQQFQYEAWLNKKKRKNTLPNQKEYQEIVQKISEKKQNDND